MCDDPLFDRPASNSLPTAAHCFTVWALHGLWRGLCLFSQIWATSDASIADQCLAPDVELDQAIVGHVHKGIQAVKDLITNYFAKARGPMPLRPLPPFEGDTLLAHAVRPSPCHRFVEPGASSELEAAHVTAVQSEQTQNAVACTEHVFMPEHDKQMCCGNLRVQALCEHPIGRCTSTDITSIDTGRACTNCRSVLMLLSMLRRTGRSRSSTTA